jgi:DNA-binding CsgD family transcriptional regulator
MEEARPTSTVEAASVLREAARDCRDRPDVAATYLRKACASAPDDAGAKLELANLLVGIDAEEARAVYGAALAHIGQAEARASTAARYGTVALGAPHAGESFEVLVEAWRALPATVDPEVRAQLELTMLVLGVNNVATVATALGHAREILPPAEVRTAPARRLVQHLAHSEVLRGESLRRALALARSASAPHTAAYEWWDLLPSRTLHFCGLPAEAEAVIDRVLKSAAAQGNEPIRTLAFGFRAWLRFDLGELADAASDAELALPGSADGDQSRRARWVRLLCEQVRARRGDDECARQLFAALPQVYEPVERARATISYARVLRNAGEGASALALLLRCGEELDAMGVRNPVLAPWWLDGVALAVELGHPTQAADLAARGRAAVTGWDTPAVRGYATLADGLVTGDAGTLEDAAHRLEAAGYRLRQTEALTALGLALLGREDDRGARKALRAAVDLAVGCGDMASANTARDALMRAGGRMGELSAGTQVALTGGERRVAQLAAEGLTNRQIADSLYVTVRTVESHLSNVYRKLGVHTRIELAAKMR